MSFLEPEWKPFETWPERQRRIVRREMFLVVAAAVAVGIAFAVLVTQVVGALR